MWRTIRDPRWDKSKLERWSRYLGFVVGVMAFGVGILVSLRKEYDFKDNPLPILIAAVASIGAVIAGMVKYLTEEVRYKDLPERDLDVHVVPHGRDSLDFLPDLFLADIKYKREALSIIKDTIPSDSALGMTENLFSNALIVSRMREQSQAIVNRLTLEISALSRRANTALIIGTVTCILGMILLGVFALLSPTEYTTWTALTGYYVPRLSVVVFLQVFAYFFLRLYRNGIFEIKYFRNEITNVQARVLALQSGLILDNVDIVKAACRSLIATERNFIIKKGEKTIPILQEEIGNLGDRMPIDFLERVIDRVVGILRRDKVHHGEKSADPAG